MTATTESTNEAERYLKEVAPHLVEMPEEERTELLDDLAQHLREIAAEEGPPLRERLGPPETYAAELLASAGVTPGGRGRYASLGRALTAFGRLKSSTVGQEVVRLMPMLRSAWWYDLEGRLLDPVLLYDQAGRPVDNLCPSDDSGRPLSTEYRVDANGAPVLNVFPRLQSRPAPGAGSRFEPFSPVSPPAVVIPRLATTTTTTPTTVPGR